MGNNILDKTDRTNAQTASVEALGALVLELRQSGLRNLDVLRAIETVPREMFVPSHLRALAGRNSPLPIGCGQTMEAPGVLALMLDALEVTRDHRIMEIGAGSGYGTAALAQLGREVVSFERFDTLRQDASARLEKLGVVNAVIHGSDGQAEPERYGRFDRILVSACLPAPPERLLSMLAPEGLLICSLPQDGTEILCVIRQSDNSIRKFGTCYLGQILQGVAQVL